MNRFVFSLLLIFQLNLSLSDLILVARGDEKSQVELCKDLEKLKEAKKNQLSTLLKNDQEIILSKQKTGNEFIKLAKPRLQGFLDQSSPNKPLNRIKEYRFKLEGWIAEKEKLEGERKKIADLEDKELTKRKELENINKVENKITPEAIRVLKEKLESLKIKNELSWNKQMQHNKKRKEIGYDDDLIQFEKNLFKEIGYSGVEYYERDLEHNDVSKRFEQKVVTTLANWMIEEGANRPKTEFVMRRSFRSNFVMKKLANGTLNSAPVEPYFIVEFKIDTSGKKDNINLTLVLNDESRAQIEERGSYQKALHDEIEDLTVRINNIKSNGHPSPQPKTDGSVPIGNSE